MKTLREAIRTDDAQTIADIFNLVDYDFIDAGKLFRFAYEANSVSICKYLDRLQKEYKISFAIRVSYSSLIMSSSFDMFKYIIDTSRRYLYSDELLTLAKEYDFKKYTYLLSVMEKVVK